MGMDVTATFCYGWKVSQKDIPDYDKHEYEDWEDVFETEDYCVVLAGHKTDYAAYDLVSRESYYDENSDYYIGIPLHGGCTAVELNAQLTNASLYARHVYLTVMNDEPKEEPKVWLYERWW